MKQGDGIRLSCQGCRHFLLHMTRIALGDAEILASKAKICLEKLFICLLACNVHTISVGLIFDLLIPINPKKGRVDKTG